jgi:quinol monooxygenase YgiN
MIELHLVLRVPLTKIRPMIDALQALAGAVRAESGCIAVEVYQAVGIPSCVCYIETWESEVKLRKMILSRHFSQLAALMEQSIEPPDCQFRFIEEIRALEYAAQVRECSGDS